MAVRDLVGKELCDPATDSQTSADVQIDMVILLLFHPEDRQGRPDRNEKELGGEDGVQQLVHQSHQIRYLGRRLFLVHHDLSLVAHVQTNTVAVRCILERTASQQQVLGTARLNLIDHG